MTALTRRNLRTCPVWIWLLHCAITRLRYVRLCAVEILIFLHSYWSVELTLSLEPAKVDQSPIDCNCKFERAVRELLRRVGGEEDSIIPGAIMQHPAWTHPYVRSPIR